MANSIQASFTLEGKDAIRTLNLIQKSIEGTSKTGVKSFKAMDIAFGSFVGNLGAQAVLSSLRFISDGVKQASRDTLEFGKALAEINTIVPRTAQETLVLKQQLIALSNEFGDKPQKQARAFYNILSAGVTDSAEAVNFLAAANKAGTAGLVDVDTAARGLLSVVNSYADGSLSAAQASDILFVTIREGRTTFGELADTIGRVSSISASAKVAFSEVAGALAFVTKSGIRTDEAVIGLRALFTSVIGPTEDVAKVAKEIGLEFNATALQTKGLGGFLNELATATKGNVETLRALFPNVRAFNVAVKIAGGDLEDFNRILGETSNATGATDKAFAIVSDSAAFQLQKLETQLQNFPVAILTNFEEPLSDALKIINEFVGNQGIILIADSVEAVISAFQFFNEATSTTQQFINFLAADLLRVAKNWSELALTTNEALQATQKFFGFDVSESLTKEEEALKKRIKLIEGGIEASEKATLKLQQEEEARFNSSESFRKKIQDSRKRFEQAEEQRRSDQLQKDKDLANEQLNNLIKGETNKFDALKELRAAQASEEADRKEEEKIARQLEADEEFQFLVDNLGREQTLRELNRIKDINGEAKRIAELKKLREKATKEEKAGILSVRKFEDLTAKERLTAQKQTFSNIAALSQETNSTLFAIGKAASLSLAGINVAEGVTKALSAFPPPFNFAAAAAVGAAGAIQIARIASAKPPSAGNFQSGGIIDVPGGSQTGDRLTAGVNNREAVFNLRQQKNLFRAVDSGQLGGGNNLTFNSPVFLNEEMIDDFIDKVNDRVEFGNKRLLSSEVA